MKAKCKILKSVQLSTPDLDAFADRVAAAINEIKSKSKAPLRITWDTDGGNVWCFIEWCE